VGVRSLGVEGTGARAALIRERGVKVDESRRKRVGESTCQRESERVRAQRRDRGRGRDSIK
jgi:hypothetical protein